MKKFIVSIVLLFLVIAPVYASASVIKYEGSGYYNYSVYSADYSSLIATYNYDISIDLKILDQPFDYYTGQPLTKYQIYNTTTQTVVYDFNILNWSINISGVGTFSGNNGYIYVEKLSPFTAGSKDIWIGDAMIFLTSPALGMIGQAPPSGNGYYSNGYNYGQLPSQMTLLALGLGGPSFPNFNSPYVIEDGVIPIHAVPEPSTFLLVSAGLFGMGFLMRKTKK